MNRIRSIWSSYWQRLPAWARYAVFAALLAVVLWKPSSGLASAILWGTGLYGLWHWRGLLAAWRNPTGLFFALGILWFVLSTAWSSMPCGTARDLIKSAPIILAAAALPLIFRTPRRIWTALLTAAGLVSCRIAVDLVRLLAQFGWPAVLQEARFFEPYLYIHPNVSSMMAGVCVFVFVAEWMSRATKWRTRLLLLLPGILLNLAYIVVTASRGPQLFFVFAMAAFFLLLVPTWKLRLAVVLLAALTAFGLWQAVGLINPRMLDHTAKNFNGRDVVWTYVKTLTDEHPVIGYGFGKKTFNEVVYNAPDRAPPESPFYYPHAHSYWLMLYFQGGLIALLLWGFGWLALFDAIAKYYRRQEPPAGTIRARLEARLLPTLLFALLLYILWYGIVDFPDHLIRQVQFYLAGLTAALVFAQPQQLPKDGGAA